MDGVCFYCLHSVFSITRDAYMTFFKWINDQYFLCGWASRRWDEAWIIVGDMLTQRMESVSPFFTFYQIEYQQILQPTTIIQLCWLTLDVFHLFDVARVSYKWFSVELSKQAVWTIVGSRKFDLNPRLNCLRC